MRDQNPRFGERDSHDQNVVRPDALTGGFKMGAGTAGDLGPGPSERQNFNGRAEAGQEFETAHRVCAAMRAEHHFRDGDNRESDILPSIGCKRRSSCRIQGWR